MEKGLDKRGQFYLAAAVIIMVIIFGIFAASNYVNVSREKNVIYDLRNELNLESARVVDFSIYNKNDTMEKLENWTKTYIEGSQDKEVEDWVFIYGDRNNLTILYPQTENSGQIGIEIGDSAQTIIPINSYYIWRQYASNPGSGGAGDTITINITGIKGMPKTTFKLKKGLNFMFILKKMG
jgi:hypothetical protein